MAKPAKPKEVEKGAAAQRIGGRQPTPIDPDELAKLASVLNQEQIADYYGMTDRGLRKRFAAEEDLRIAYQAGRARAITKVAESLLKQATKRTNPNIVAMIFYLKTQAGWKDRPDDTGGGGSVGDPATIAADVRTAVREMLKADGINGGISATA